MLLIITLQFIKIKTWKELLRKNKFKIPIISHAPKSTLKNDIIEKRDSLQLTYETSKC